MLKRLFTPPPLWATSEVLSLGFDVIGEPEYASSSQNNASSSAVNSMFLHQRCACHILNLIVKEALITLKPFIESFRTAISFLNSSNQIIAA